VKLKDFIKKLYPVHVKNLKETKKATRF